MIVCHAGVRLVGRERGEAVGRFHRRTAGDRCAAPQPRPNLLQACVCACGREMRAERKKNGQKEINRAELREEGWEKTHGSLRPRRPRWEEMLPVVQILHRGEPLSERKSTLWG